MSWKPAALRNAVSARPVLHADRFRRNAAPASSDASSGRVQAGRRRIIVAVNLASFALIFESSALTVALPALAREWRAPLGTMQWVADASLLTSALLLLFAGRLSDEKGTRRMMRLGLIGTAACAMASSLAPSGGMADNSSTHSGRVCGAGRSGNARVATAVHP